MMRFDMRAPETGAPAADLYKAAIEMAAWGETRGGIVTVICEHHSAEDGYLRRRSRSPARWPPEPPP